MFQSVGKVKGVLDVMTLDGTVMTYCLSCTVHPGGTAILVLVLIKNVIYFPLLHMAEVIKEIGEKIAN